MTPETVTITLLTGTRTIGAVTCALGFGAKSGTGFDGLHWTIARIGTESFAVAITGLKVGLDKPTGPDRSLIASSAGAVDVAKLALDVAGSYPDGRIEIAQPAGKTLVLADFLTDFGLHPQDFLNSLTLKDLDFVVVVPSKSGSIRAKRVTQTGAALVLVQGDGAGALLSLANASLDGACSATLTDVAIKGQFRVMEALSFDIAASYKDDRQTPKGKAAPPGSGITSCPNPGTTSSNRSGCPRTAGLRWIPRPARSR